MDKALGWCVLACTTAFCYMMRHVAPWVDVMMAAQWVRLLGGDCSCVVMGTHHSSLSHHMNPTLHGRLLWVAGQ